MLLLVLVVAGAGGTVRAGGVDAAPPDAAAVDGGAADAGGPDGAAVDADIFFPPALDNDDGCDCAVGEAGAPAWGGLLLVAAVALALRRRRGS